MESSKQKEKIFGIGLHKTGTSTLGHCLEILGYNPHISHDLMALKLWKESRLDELYPVIDAHRSFEDWPWPLMYPILFEKYPNSKFILTTRESTERWYQSLSNHAIRTGPTEHRKLIYGYEMPQENEVYHKGFYERHNSEVISFFEKNAPHQLLIVCWERGDQWEKMCQFLQKDIPHIPFPHLNQKKISVNKKLWKRVKSAVKLGLEYYKANFRKG